MSSFILSRFPVPHSVFSAVQGELAHLGPEQRRFVLHVLISNVLNLNKIRHHGLDGWLDVAVELPCQWIEEHFGRAFKVAEIDSTILTFENYSTALNRCRAFKASDALLSTVLEWAPLDAAAAANEPVVNLFDGSPYRVQAPQQWEDGVFSPKVIRDAIKIIESCPFQYQALDAHLAETSQQIQSAPNDKERVHRELAFRNDKACAMRIRAGCKPNANGVAHYQPEYRTSFTGRITEIGGGAQSCSREMKQAMFEGIAGLRNYDLKRAQAFILLQELEDARLPRDWVERYVHEPNANDTRAAAIGISKDAYKTCLYATVMGATHTRLFDARKNELFHVLLKAALGDRPRAIALTLKVYGALEPLKLEVKAWHDHLMTHAECRHVDPTRKSVRTLKNACGQDFSLEGERADRLARRAAAFILQGQEAAFIHRLTVLGTTNGFVSVSNQHDGLIVLGEIPPSAVEQAAKASGLITLDPELVKVLPVALKKCADHRPNSTPGMLDDLVARAQKENAIEAAALSMVGLFSAGDVRDKIGDPNADVTPVLRRLVRQGKLLPPVGKKRWTRYQVASPSLSIRVDWTG